MEKWCFSTHSPQLGVRLLFVLGIAYKQESNSRAKPLSCSRQHRPQKVMADDDLRHWPMLVASQAAEPASDATAANSRWQQGQDPAPVHRHSARTSCLSADEESARLFFCFLFFSFLLGHKARFPTFPLLKSIKAVPKLNRGHVRSSWQLEMICSGPYKMLVFCVGIIFLNNR